MIYPYDLEVLVFPTALIFTCVLFFSIKASCSLQLSLFLALLKSFIYAFYFNFVFDGTYTFLDDWTYLNVGKEILNALENGVADTDFFFALANSDHVIYYFLNALAFVLFGFGYYAPVALNVLLTPVIAYVGSNLLVSSNILQKKHLSIMYVFILIHPDILAWSNIMNGKDILVLMMHVFLLYSFFLLFKGEKAKFFLLFSTVTWIMLYLRFYVPVLFGLSFILYTVTKTILKKFSQMIIASTSAAALIYIIPWQESISVFFADFVNPFYGLFRFLLTPVPFHTEVAYSFLDLPAFIHWVWLPFSVIGVIRLLKMNTEFSRFLVIYFFMFVLFYSMYGELQGPRHRVQLDFAWATFQFVGLLIFIQSALYINKYRVNNRLD